MKYTVLSDFLEDSHLYRKGDTYPCEGIADESRAGYLLSPKLNHATAFLAMNEVPVSNPSEEQETDSYSKLTIPQLKRELKERGIECPAKAGKNDLLKLVRGG